MAAVESFILQPGRAMPNNPRLPVLLYRRALEGEGADPALAFEALFKRNGWPPQWRNGIFAYHHYHSTTHEVLGIARGGTSVLLGGPEGREVTVSAGDVLVLAVGTGHCNLSPGSDLLVVGAYPPGLECDLRREAPKPDILRRMARIRVPDTDPVEGPGGALSRLWATA